MSDQSDESRKKKVASMLAQGHTLVSTWEVLRDRMEARSGQ